MTSTDGAPSRPGSGPPPRPGARPPRPGRRCRRPSRGTTRTSRPAARSGRDQRVQRLDPAAVPRHQQHRSRLVLRHRRGGRTGEPRTTSVAARARTSTPARPIRTSTRRRRCGESASSITARCRAELHDTRVVGRPQPGRRVAVGRLVAGHLALALLELPRREAAGQHVVDPPLEAGFRVVDGLGQTEGPAGTGVRPPGVGEAGAGERGVRGVGRVGRRSSSRRRSRRGRRWRRPVRLTARPPGPGSPPGSPTPDGW